MGACQMAGCHTKGACNYRCAECDELKVFVCEGCELELLNGLRELGKVALVCTPCAGGGTKRSERAKEIKVAPLLKASEKLRQALIDNQKFEESVFIRDLSVLA